MTRFSVSAALCLGFAACAPAATPDARPLVAVSVVPQRYLVRAVAGDRVRVQVMVPPGASPATYEPTMAQLRALDEAALYVKVGHPGFPFEAAWLDGILADVPDLPVVDAAAGLEPSGDDPHLWVVPRHAEHMAAQVERALEDVLPDERETLRANLEAFRARAAALDRELRSELDALRGREFFVFHPAWGSFAQEYGLRQVAVEHEHKAPGPRELQVLIRRAAASRARVIFVQPQFDPASAQALARETGARVEVLDPLAEDWDVNLRRAARALAEALRE